MKHDSSGRSSGSRFFGPLGTINGTLEPVHGTPGPIFGIVGPPPLSAGGGRDFGA